MTTVIKTIITTVLVSVLLATASDAEARLKYYRYNANIPMVEMTLNMMVAMGVLEQIPGRLVHDGNPYNRYVSAQYDRHSRSPYARVSTGYYDGPGYDGYRDWDISPYRSYYDSRYDYGGPYESWDSAWNNPWDGYWGGRYSYNSPYGYNNPYRSFNSPYGYNNPYSSWDSPWGGPWSNTGFSTWGSPTWGSPTWGNPTWGNPWNSVYGSQWGAPWGSQWGNQLNSPWGGNGYSPWTSSWNNPWISPWSSTVMNPFASPYGGIWNGSGVPGSSIPGYTAPGYSVPGYSVPGNSTMPMSPGYSQGYTPGNTSTHGNGGHGASSTVDDGGSVNTHIRTDKTNDHSYTFRKSAASVPSNRHDRPHRRAHDRNDNRQEWPSRQSRLDGLWIGDSGEMLGIRGNSFLFYDGNKRYADGRLSKTPTMLKATVSGSNRVFNMQYRLVGNELFTVSRNGKMRAFSRTPLMQSHNEGRLHATPSSYRTESARSMPSMTILDPDSPIVPAPSASHRSAPDASATADTDRYSDAAFHSYSGEKSPMWGPGASSASATAAIDRSETAVSIDNDRSRVIADVPSTVPAVSVFTETGHENDVSNNRASPSTAFDDHAGYWVSGPYVQTFDAGNAIWKPLVADMNRQNTVQSKGKERIYAPYIPGAVNYALADTDTEARRVNTPAGRSWGGNSTTADSQDPYTYLFSYVKDQGGSMSAAAPNTGGSGNIWKPNDAFPDTRAYRRVARDYDTTHTTRVESGPAVDSAVRRFAWTASNQW